MINVLTLNWNGLDKLKMLHPGLVRNLDKLELPYTWHVRDNGSVDGSKEWLKNQTNINLLDIDHNRDNFAQGVNSLFKMITGDIILLLNNDIIFNDDTSLFNMFNIMEKTNAAIVGCKLKYENGKISHNGVIFSKKYNDMPWHFMEGEPDVDNKNRYFQAVTAACCFIKTDVFDKLNGLNDEFFWAFEDIDFNLKVSKQLKLPIVCCGETNITHLTSASLKKNPVNKLFLQSNIKKFKGYWFGKYEIDHDKYLRDPGYMLIR